MNVSTGQSLRYYLPSQGETKDDLRSLPGVWANEVDENDWEDFVELVAEYENAINPNSADVTVTVVDLDTVSATFEVKREMVYRFSATELPCVDPFDETEKGQ
jgi:F420-0:gamma-glutamyl ligase-like protein